MRLRTPALATLFLSARSATVPDADLPREPEHWRTFGGRASPLTGSPRLSVNPANAILNYLYAVVESEAGLASVALGLDAGLGSSVNFDFLIGPHPLIEDRIAFALREVESGRPPADVCRQLGVSEATFYIWKKKFA